MDAESSSPSSLRPEPAPGSGGAEPHLTVAELREYRAHRLDAAEEARMQEHLAACDECRELAVDVSAFFDAEEPGESSVPVDKAASWGRLEASLTREGWFEEQRKRRKFQVGQVLKVAAAVIALTVAGLTQLLVGFGREGTVLVPVGAYKGAGDDVATVRLPARLKLTLAAVADSPELRVDLFDSSGAKIRSYEGRRADREGRLALRLRRWQLAPGRYRLEVRASPESPGNTFDEFEFEVGRR